MLNSLTIVYETTQTPNIIKIKFGGKNLTRYIDLLYACFPKTLNTNFNGSSKTIIVKSRLFGYLGDNFMIYFILSKNPLNILNPEKLYGRSASELEIW